MIMKKNSLIAITFALLGTLIADEVSAQDVGSNYSDYCATDCSEGQFVVGAEWLYWKVAENNAALGITIAGNSDKTSPDFFSTATDYIEPNFKFSNGFRVSAGYAMPCNGWELDVIYTYLPSHASSSVYKSSGSAVETQVPGPYEQVGGNPYVLIYQPIINTIRDGSPRVLGLSVLPFEKFQQKWNIALNQIDLDVSRTLGFNNCISLKPHAGFRALWYTNKQRVIGEGKLNPVDPIAPAEEPSAAAEIKTTFATDILFKNEFTGYGVEAGLWGKWQIWEGLSILGHFGGAILYSKYKVNETADTVVTTTTSQTVITPYVNTICDTIHTATPMVDYYLGLEYVEAMCDMTFAVRAGWEQHVYFDANRIFQYGDLSTQGLTLGLVVGF